MTPEMAKELSGMLDELESILLTGAHNPEVLEKWAAVRAAFAALPADQTSAAMSAAMSELIGVFRKRLQSCVEALTRVESSARIV